MKKYLAQLCGAIALLIVIDQLTKFIIYKYFFHTVFDIR